MKTKTIAILTVIISIGTILVSVNSLRMVLKNKDKIENLAVKDYKIKIEKTYSNYLKSIYDFKKEKSVENNIKLSESLTKYQESMFSFCLYEEKQDKFMEKAELIAVDSFLSDTFYSDFDLFLSNLELKKDELLSFYQECSND